MLIGRIEKADSHLTNRTSVKMATLLVSIWRQRWRWECVIKNPRGTVKVTADVTARCRSSRQKAVLCDKARKHSFSMYILFEPLRPPCTWGWFLQQHRSLAGRGVALEMLQKVILHCHLPVGLWAPQPLSPWAENMTMKINEAVGKYPTQWALCVLLQFFFRPDAKCSENVGGEDGF